MDRHHHPSNNSVLGAPPGVDIDSCHALPITRVVFSDTGGDACASYWMPSAAELALLRQGRAVRLLVWGRTHAPIAVGVDGDGLL